jgi:hypothetical protein
MEPGLLDSETSAAAKRDDTTTMARGRRECQAGLERFAGLTFRGSAFNLNTVASSSPPRHLALAALAARRLGHRYLLASVIKHKRCFS